MITYDVLKRGEDLMSNIQRTKLKECDCGCRLFYTRKYQALYKEDNTASGIYEIEYICKECDKVIHKQTLN